MKKILFIIIFLVVAVVAYLGVQFASAYRTIVVEPEHTGAKSLLCFIKKCETKINKIKDDPHPIPQNSEDHVTILILGVRGENDSEHGGLLSDTIMFADINKLTGRVNLISLPRDFYIDMTGTLTDGSPIEIKGKLNEIYVRGYEHNQGLTLASQMVSRITGVYVDRAILFDFKAFGDIIDALGGVDITLAKPFSEKTQWGYEFSLPAGPNHLTGEQALYYVRSRFSSSDFDRARRQQEVILAIKKKATELGFLTNPNKITAMIEALKGNLKTNIPLWEVKDLLTLGQNIKSANIKSHVLTTDNLLYETHLPNGEYVLLPKGDDFFLLREYFRTTLAE